MLLIDSHCHLNFPDFVENYQEIIADCLEKGIGVVNIGADLKSSERAVEIANEYPNDPIYASIGVHPGELDKGFDVDKFQKMIGKKVVAVGEIGLEYYYPNTESTKNPPTGYSLFKRLTLPKGDKKTQQNFFIKQLEFAQKNNLPVVLHVRGSKENPNDAYEDLLEIISTFLSSRRKSGSRQKNNNFWIPDQVGNDNKKTTGVLHCFGANTEIAQKFIDLDFYLGFTGIITFKNKSIDNLRQVVKIIPLDRILVETDAPWLTPEPQRGEKNLPQNVEFVARKVAELKKVSYEEVCQQTTENFRKIFLNDKFQISNQ